LQVRWLSCSAQPWATPFGANALRCSMRYQRVVLQLELFWV